MSKSFLTYLRESSKPSKIELFNLIQDKPEFLEIAKKYGIEPTLEDKLEFYNIENYTIREDGETVDVDDNVYLLGKNLTKIPFKFGKVTRNFKCYNNLLTSLEGSPSSVGGSFSCSHNQLETLDAAPSSVGGDFHCTGNKKKFTEEAVRKISRVKGGIYV